MSMILRSCVARDQRSHVVAAHQPFWPPLDSMETSPLRPLQTQTRSSTPTAAALDDQDGQVDPRRERQPRPPAALPGPTPRRAQAQRWRPPAPGHEVWCPRSLTPSTPRRQARPGTRRQRTQAHSPGRCVSPPPSGRTGWPPREPMRWAACYCTVGSPCDLHVPGRWQAVGRAAPIVTVVVPGSCARWGCPLASLKVSTVPRTVTPHNGITDLAKAQTLSHS